MNHITVALFKLLLTTKAKVEIEEAVDQYELIDLGLGARLRNEVLGFINVIKSHPDVFLEEPDGTRRVRMGADYPHELVYFFNPGREEVTVLHFEEQQINRSSCTRLV